MDNPVRFGYARRMQIRVQLSFGCVLLICAIAIAATVLYVSYTASH